LSHHNLVSNLESLRQVFDTDGDDAILSLLPFSNAMAYATALWLPALSGARVVFGAPRLGAGLGELLRAARPTLLAATPPLLERLVAECAREDLASLRFVATGGEDLTDAVRDA